jgi:hypothetical protein
MTYDPSNIKTCKCITKYGERCKNRIREDEKYCHIHKNCNSRKSLLINNSARIEPKYKFRTSKDVSSLFDELKLSDVDDSLKLFSGGFGGIESIIAEQLAHYYIFETVWIIDNSYNVTRNFIVAIPEGPIHVHFLEFVESDRISEFIIPLILERYPDESLGRHYSTSHKEVSYKEAQNMEDIEDFFMLDISDFGRSFRFRTDEKGYSNNPTKEDEKLLKRVINSILTKNYKEYDNLVNRLHPNLVYKILPYIDVKNYKLVMPLFNWREPIIFSYYNMMYKRDVNKFIVKVLIQAIEDNNISLTEMILSRLENNRYNKNELLIDYCVELAKQINSNTLDILLNYQKMFKD